VGVEEAVELRGGERVDGQPGPLIDHRANLLAIVEVGRLEVVDVVLRVRAVGLVRCGVVHGGLLAAGCC
jgi:hypothetical protein